MILFTPLLATLLIAPPPQAQAAPNLAVQKEAMKKLDFLVGKWSGDASVTRGPGPAIKVTQTENVQYKLDGLVLLVEGTGTRADGTVAFQALATISYDEATKKYAFRAFNDGRVLDTELKVSEKSFVWGFASGPLKVTNTMNLSDKDEWVETTDYVFGDQPPRRSVEMRLKRVSSQL